VASLELQSKYLLIMELRSDAMLCANMGNEILKRAISNVHVGRIFPTTGLKGCLLQ